MEDAAEMFIRRREGRCFAPGTAEFAEQADVYCTLLQFLELVELFDGEIMVSYPVLFIMENGFFVT
jgi:hypothetical protein